MTGRALYTFPNVSWTSSRCWSLHLNFLGTFYWVRYNDAMWWRTLWARYNTWNSIHLCMGSQWGWWQSGVECLFHHVSVTFIAIRRLSSLFVLKLKLFCLYYKWAFWLSGNPLKFNKGFNDRYISYIASIQPNTACSSSRYTSQV